MNSPQKESNNVPELQKMSVSNINPLYSGLQLLQWVSEKARFMVGVAIHLISYGTQIGLCVKMHCTAAYKTSHSLPFVCTQVVRKLMCCIDWCMGSFKPSHSCDQL